MLWPLAPRLPCPTLPVRARRSAPGLCQLGGLQLLDPELRGGTRPAPSYRPFSTRVPSAPGSTPGGPAPGPEYRGAGTPTGLWLGESPNLQLPLTGLPDLKLYWRRPGPAHREGSQTGRTVRLNPWSGAARAEAVTFLRPGLRTWGCLHQREHRGFFCPNLQRAEVAAL